jgi:hypothetical protein
MKELFFILLVFILINSIAQINNLLSNIAPLTNLTRVSIEPGQVIFFRSSLITQSIYLLTGLIFYTIFKYYAVQQKSCLDIVFWGVRILLAFGFFEVIMFFITKENGDIFSNREFDGRSSSSFQTWHIAGIEIQRMKSLTGEPSMFSFTLVPFFILAIALERKLDAFLIFAALSLTFSTTFYLAFFIFFILFLCSSKNVNTVISTVVIVFLLAFTIYIFRLENFFIELYNSVIGEKNSSVSADIRSNNFVENLEYWLNANFFTQLFGLGFGYIRSSDFFTTILVNNGFIGLLLFTYLFFKNLSITKAGTEQRRFSLIILIVTYSMMMTSVPEFAYLSMWLTLVTPYILVLHSKENEKASSLKKAQYSHDW